MAVEKKRRHVVQEEEPPIESTEDPIDDLTDEELEALAAEMNAPRVSGSVQNELLLEWEANDRPYTPLNKEIFSTIVAGVFLLGVILYFIDGVIPVMMLASLVFLWYVLGTVPPQKVINRITSWGIESGDKLYVWDAMTRFWIEGEGLRRVLVVELLQGLPRHVRLVIESDEMALEVKDIMRDFLVEDAPKPNWLDKLSGWLEKRIKWSVR